MRRSVVFTYLAITGASAGVAIAEQQPGTANKAASVQASEEEAIRETARLFVEAFNRADAKAIAALVTESAEYVTADGRVLRGRVAIQEDFVAFFDQNPGLQIALSIDSLRLLGPSIAIEDGRTWTLRAPVGAPKISRYTTVHSKQNGRWLVASVRESGEEIPSNYTHLKDLEWLIGTWTAETEGAQIRATCEWTPNKNFMKRSYTVYQGGDVVSTGTQVIGWDPASNQITSWTFDSSGGHGRAVFTRDGNRVIVQATAVLSDGSQASATNIITPVDENRFTWQSTNRSINGESLADVGQVNVVRVSSVTQVSRIEK